MIAKDSCAYDGYVNSIYTIAITGVIALTLEAK